jgi:hypothetical protein
MHETVEQRLARLEAAEQIRQLASRYGLAVDSRDMDAIVALFVNDGRPVFYRGDVGTPGGRALKKSYIAAQSRYTASQHYMCNHIIDFDDDTHAHGVVYAIIRQEREGKYFVIEVAYWDKYEKVGKKWLFAERRPRTWNPADWHVEEISPVPTNRASALPSVGALPEAFPSWAPFWKSVRRRQRKSSG